MRSTKILDEDKPSGGHNDSPEALQETIRYLRAKVSRLQREVERRGVLIADMLEAPYQHKE